MKIIGLTGNIATGKSTVGEIFEKLGARLIDADQVARTVVEPDKPAWREIVDNFGTEVLGSDRSIDREKLGQIVFNDNNKRLLLNNITHPKITQEIQRLIETEREKGAKIVVIEAALIIENNGWLRDIVDYLVVVSADKKSQIDRLMSRNNHSEKEALARISSQMPSAEKEKHGDFVVDNSGSIEDTEKQIFHIWETINKTI